LTVVLAGAQLISKKPGATPDILKLTTQILEAVDRGTSLTTELMTFGRNPQQNTCVLDTAAVVQAMTPMLQTTVGDPLSDQVFVAMPERARAHRSSPTRNGSSSISC